ncbi:choice-of-anchor C family protein [Nodularia spumigena]|uniref:choice-of-anchor C family protein n=1 Tax=Nodularia spumigena TaxID=70799 RepID=UPI002B213375|nr:choice-of-anchor C family protein [Nodularia spumigena]MEA5614557.1 choice-of-anchor C family protein [Nodularia spumigena UHCC 0040]
MKTSMCLTVAAVAALAGPAMAGTNLIINGSFEESNLNPGSGWIPMNGGNTAIVGWTTIGAGIDYMGTILAASDGTRSIDLNNVTSGGGIEQSFTTVAGWIYTVEFDLSANMYGGPTPKVMRVGAAGQSEQFEFDYVAAGATAANPAWERITWSFVGNGSSATLRFEGISGGVYGADIDNVIVTGRVPTPGTAALIGMGGLVALRRRR